MFPADYELSERLYEGDRSAVYRAHRADGTSVILKMPSPRADRSARSRALTREFETLRKLEALPGVIGAYDLLRGGVHALVLQDLKASSLRGTANCGQLPLDAFLRLAIRLVDLLDQVHSRGVIHGDFHLSNVLVDATGEALWLTDFCNSSWVKARDSGAPFSSRRQLDGVLAYFSPEQTGRPSRPVDHRSDYYALGVTLFELLTGQLPFSYSDPLELVHAQVARSAPHPADLVPGLPDQVADVVLKLMAKEVDERYFDARSLRHDLMSCGEQTRPVSFVPARSRPERAPKGVTLYGRSVDLRKLEELFSESCEGSAVFVAVTGTAGIGKSALVKKLSRSVIARGGHFVVGKFEQYGGASPHLGLAQALETLGQNLLTYDSTELAALRASVTNELAGLGEVLVELCPALGMLLGPQPKLPPLPANETRARLQRALGAFFTGITDPRRPLCLFLDDVQWAGADSISLVSHLVAAGKTQPLLVVLGMRDDQFSGNEALNAATASLRAQRVRTETIALEPLGPNDVNTLIQGAFALSSELAAPLADIVCSRTQGNPFFVHAFLESLRADGLLGGPDADRYVDIELVRQRGVTENVTKLLIEQIDRLPAETQEVLRLAACLGGRFDAESLELFVKRPVERDLSLATNAQLLLRVNGSGGSASYRFAHDRIQQAAFSMLEPIQLKQLHLAIGRQLLSASQTGVTSRLFEIVSHLNAALDLLDDSDERVRLAELDLDAARTALTRALGSEALHLARAGIAALGAEGWACRYELCAALHLVAAEAAFAWAEHDALAELARQMAAQARSPVDSARARRWEGRLYQAQSRASEAVEVYIAALAALGVVLPPEPDDADVQNELALTAAALEGRRASDLVELPRCADEQSVLSMELLGKLIFFGYSAGTRVFPVAVCRLVRMSIDRGTVPDTANGLTFYGLLLSRDNDHQGAQEFGGAALALAHEFAEPAVLSQTYLYVHYQLMHWRVPLNQLFEPLAKAYEYGLAAGSPLNAGCSATTLCICRFWAGDELGGLAADMATYRQVIIQFRQTLVQNWHEILEQTVHNLRFPSARPAELAGPIYDEAVRLPVHEQNKDRSALFNYHSSKSLLCYLFGDYDRALHHADECAGSTNFRNAIRAIPATFLDSLCRLAVLEKAGAVRRQALLEGIARNVEMLERLQAHNPASVQHKLVAIEAELARVGGDVLRARARYAEAVDLAASSGCALEEGIIGELAARFAAEAADSGGAYFYLRGAHRAYARWGASVKVAELEARHPELAPRALLQLPEGELVSEQMLDPFDLVGVLNMSRAISSEIKLEPLLERMLTLLAEVARAQSVYLLVPRDGHWVVEAGRGAGGSVKRPTPLTDVGSLASGGGHGLASSVVNYVAQTGTTVVLADAARDDRFAQDRHVSNRGVLSLLCFPLRRRGETIGIVYLENNLARGVFTAHSVRLLELLSAQAVISLENARIVDSLEHKVEARTAQLQERNDELARTVEKLMQVQEQLVTREKLAALGLLTAGIAHEIKNPLNFVMNFAHESSRLLDEVLQLVAVERLHGDAHGTELGEAISDLRLSLTKIREHGKRASDIVAGMALHARNGSGRREQISLNRVLAQSVMLASHGFRANGEYDVSLLTDYDARVGEVEMAVEDMSRVFVNVISNARYAVEEKRRQLGATFAPQIVISTRDFATHAEVSVRDNGIGIPTELVPKVMLPFFTTKPSGQGTGLGLSISQDIVRAHGGQLRIESVEHDFTNVIVILPKVSPVRTGLG